MSSSNDCPNIDGVPVEPIVGYILLSVNSTPIVRRSVTEFSKRDVLVQLARTACELWTLFGVACSLSVEFVSEKSNNHDVILNFKR